MMHRPPFAGSARSFQNIVSHAMKGIKDMAADAAMAFLIKTGIYEQAKRENRQRDRQAKRHSKHTTYHRQGLNGPRAIARRQRQIASGYLTESNGLVRS